MATVSYLEGNERADAPRLNALYAAWDEKLGKILGNCSPILAFNTGPNSIPPDLLGKCFFFTVPNQVSKYAYRCPGAKVKSGQDGGTYVDPGSGLPLPRPWSDVIIYPYDHNVFTQAQAALTGLVFDEENRIVSVDQVPAPFYKNGLGGITDVSIFDHSLEVHKYRRIEPDGSVKVFVIKEKQVAHSERFHRFAVAEIILDGVQDLTIPDRWDKYCFVRIHNLNYGTASVQFGKAGGASASRRVSIPPLSCKTVRRDRTVNNGVAVFSNYRVGMEDNNLRYFFEFEGNKDLRHFWFFPSSWVAGGVNNNAMSHDSSTPSNSMCANNVTCPSIIYDWIRHLRYDRATMVDSDKRYAWVHLDEHVVHDIYPSYKDVVADPSKPSSNMGDLVFHRGKLLLVKFHKTNRILGFPQLPDAVWTEIEFKGFDTLAEDWAPHGIVVTTDANGQLRFTQSMAGDHANWNFLLVPWGTNLFRTANDGPRSAVRLDTAQPAVLDPHWFDYQEDRCALNQLAPQLDTLGNPIVARRNANLTPNTRTWAGGTESGDSLVSLVDVLPPANSQTVLWDPQRRTVSELLSLKFWRDKNQATPNTPWTGYANMRLVLTPHGHMLLFDEMVPLAGPFQRPENDVSANPYRWGEGWELHTDGGNWFLKRKRVLKCRGHGWGWKEEGRISAMHFSARHGRWLIDEGGLQNEPMGAAGADYRFKKLKLKKTDVKVQGRAKNLGNNVKSGRWWVNSWADKLCEIWERSRQDEFSFKFWLSSQGIAVLANSAGAGRQGTYPLLAEHYNGLALAVNQLTTGKRLDFRALRFVATMPAGPFSGTAFVAGFDPKKLGRFGPKRDKNIWDPPVFANPAMIPVPIDCFDFYTGAPNEDEQRVFALYAAAGIAIRRLDQTGEVPGDPYPAEFKAMLLKKNVDRQIDIKYTIEVSNAAVDSNQWFGDVSVRCEEEVSYTDSASPAGTAFFYHYGDFRKLQDVYTGFRWVSTKDVMEFLETFGLDVAYDEIFTPLELKYLESGREMSHGVMHNPGPNGFHRFLRNRQLFTETAARHNGTYLRRLRGYHRNVSMVAFCPTTDATKAKWKCALVGGRVTRNIKLWDSAKPVYQVVHGGVFIQPGGWTGESPGTGEFKDISPDPGNFAGGLSEAQLAQQNAGPFIHLEWGPEAGNEEKEKAHELWLKMNFRLLWPIAVRMATPASKNDLTAPPNIVMVHQNFWATQQDGWTANYIQHELFNEFYFPHQGEFSGTWYMPNPVALESVGTTLPRPTNKISRWLWIRAPGTSGVTFLAPALKAGINILPVEPAASALGHKYGVAYYCNIVSDYVKIAL